MGHTMSLDERTAINQMQRGDIRGLDALMRAYQVQAIRAAYLITHDLPLAEDIVQSAFIRAYERIEQYDTSRPFGPWFMRSVVNSAVTAVVRRKRHVPFVDAGSVEAFASDEFADPESGPEARMLGAETRAEVWKAVDSLPPAQRAAIVLRYYLELPEAEAAERLGIPPGTVKSRLSTARGRLRAVFGSQDSTEQDYEAVSSSRTTMQGELDEEAKR
jgi:RNA polymerase sigma-70 factor (ECF subfamily)